MIGRKIRTIYTAYSSNYFGGIKCQFVEHEHFFVHFHVLKGIVVYKDAGKQRYHWEHYSKNVQEGR